MTEFDARRESALLRTLGDIHEGHIQLWVSVKWFDPQTGEKLSEPVSSETLPDRAPCHGTPNPFGVWWTVLAERGWIRLPSAAEANHRRWVVTDEGRRVLDAAGIQRGRG